MKLNLTNQTGRYRFYNQRPLHGDQVLKRNHLNRLPQNQRKRSIPTVKRYGKQVPGHHVQIDVKFLFFKDDARKRVKRVQ